MNFRSKYILAGIIAIMLTLQSCQQPGVNSTGSEFMPDMSHSIAYEANYYNYYYNNTWGTEDEYYEYAQPRLPVENTIPRTNSDKILIPVAPMVAEYHYPDTEEGRTRAMNEIIENPYKITDKGIARGKDLFNIYCATCHGDKADGNGYLVRDNGGMYPVQPANLLTDELIDASNGRYYHSIVHGRNLMGPYGDKLNYEERWQVIHYVRSLQAKKRELVYNQQENTLNNIEEPAGDIIAEAESKSDNETEMPHEGSTDLQTEGDQPDESKTNNQNEDAGGHQNQNDDH